MGPQRHTVLVVERDPDVGLVCALHLRGAGFDVLEAHDADAALSLTHESRPDLVVLGDAVDEPGFPALVAKLRDAGAHASPRVVVVTGHTAPSLELAVWDAGASAFLTKPFEGHHLVETARGALALTDDAEEELRRLAVDRLAALQGDPASTLAAVVEGAEDAVVVCDLAGTITHWNGGAVRLFGWHADEVVGSSTEVLAPRGEHAGALARLRRVAAGVRVGTFEQECLRRDGRVMRTSVTLSPVHSTAEVVVGVSAVVRDITWRVDREDRYRRLVEAFPEAVLVVGPDGAVEQVNHVAEQIFGRSRSDLVGRSVEHLMPERFRDRHAAQRRAFGEDPTPRTMGVTGLDTLALRPDGTEVPVEVWISPLNDGSSSIAAVVRDVSHGRRRERQLRALVDAVPDPFLGLDSDGRILVLNAAAERQFGYHATDVVGRQVDLLVPDWRRWNDGAGFLGRRRDGSRFPAQVVRRSVEVGEETLVAATVRDIGSGNRAEARFRGLLESVPDAVLICDEDGHVTEVNQEAVRLFGYAAQELRGQPVEILIPEASRSHHAALRRRFERGDRHRAMGVGLELRARHKDGHEFPVEISLAPIETDEGISMCACVRDVTQTRAAAEAQQVAFEREREATARLREVDRLRTDFLSTVSHELRTPLTAIKGFAEWLVGSWETTPDARRRDMVQRILNAGGRLDFLIQDLLDFSRLERGHLKVDVRSRSLRDVVTETVKHAAPGLSGHRVEVDVDADHRVLADGSALGRVVENLLTNAAKFSPEGAPIVIRSETGDGEVRLSVRDQGLGIRAEELPKIWGRFYRAPDLAEAHPGTGIGLAIVKQFTEAQGGRVSVVSQPGEGSEFTLHLPAPAR